MSEVLPVTGLSIAVAINWIISLCSTLPVSISIFRKDYDIDEVVGPLFYIFACFMFMVKV